LSNGTAGTEDEQTTVRLYISLADFLAIDGSGDYVMALKENHQNLYDRVVRNINDLILEKFDGVDHSSDDTTESGHGRLDRRRVWATDQLDWLTAKQRWEWAGLKSVVVVESTRKLPGKTEQFRRYYLTSLPPDAKELGRLIRNHDSTELAEVWAIENSQHWCLDMGFNEDQSRVRADHGDENLAAIRRIALNLLKQDKSRKIGIANKRVKACGNWKYLLAVVTGTSNAK
jgi:predicted transposase YbfD/YdcC